MAAPRTIVASVPSADSTDIRPAVPAAQVKLRPLGREMIEVGLEALLEAPAQQVVLAEHADHVRLGILAAKPAFQDLVGPLRGALGNFRRHPDDISLPPMTTTSRKNVVGQHVHTEGVSW